MSNFKMTIREMKSDPTYRAAYDRFWSRAIVVKTCQHCGDEFTTRSGDAPRMYCSERCRNIASTQAYQKALIEAGVCINCGKEPAGIGRRGRRIVRCTSCNEAMLERRKNREGVAA